MDTGFWFQVLIQFLGGLLAVTALGLAGWFGARFLRRCRVAAPAASRPLRLLVVLARPLVACGHRDAGDGLVPAEDSSEDGMCRVPITRPGAVLSCEALGRAFAGMQVPIAVRYLRVPTFAALQEALSDRYDALLFAGPRLEDGALALESPYGEQQAVSSEELGHRLQGGDVRLVYLNACYSTPVAQALRRAGVVAVVGTPEAVREDVAAASVADFFAALARGQNVHQARAVVRKAIAGRFTAQAGAEATLQCSAWRWPALRLVQSGLVGEYTEKSPPLPLPVPPTVDLVGREVDIVLTNRCLAHHRLVSLVGWGGVGKTALAQAVARWHWERRLAPAGVLFVSLDGLRSGQELADALLHHLEPTYRPPESVDAAGLFRHKVSRLSARLGQGKWLFVLDSFETVLDAEAGWLVQKLLEQCAGLHLLLTARKRTGLAKEQVYLVKPLAEDSAVELLHRRAKRSIGEPGRKHVAAICQALDHIPLAIELAARHTERPLVEIRDALHQACLRLNATLTEIQRVERPARSTEGQPGLGLSVALDYSYHRLSTEAQCFFCAFPVFRGGATEEALQAVMEGLPYWDRALEELLDRSLLVREPADGTWRYQMLPVVAEYAGRCFRQDAARLALDEVSLYRRHAQYYLQLARQVDHMLTPGERGRETVEEAAQEAELSVREVQQRVEQTTLALLTQERPNLLAAFEGAYRTGAWDLVWRLAQEVSRGFLIRSYWVEWERTHLLALEAARRSGDPYGEGQVLTNLGDVYRRQGRWAEALARYEQTLAICRELGDRHAEGKMLTNLGNVYADQNHWTEAIAMYQKSLRLFRKLGARHDEGQALSNLGHVHRRQGRWTEALARYEQTLVICRQLEDRHDEGRTLMNLGDVYSQQGRWAEARDCYEQNLAICHQLGDRHGEGRTLTNLGNLHLRRRHWTEATACHEQSLAIYRELEDRRGESRSLANLGDVHRRQGGWAEATAMLQESLRLCRELEDHHGEGQVLNSLGEVYAGQGHWAESMATFQECLYIFRDLENRYGEGRTLRKLGRVYADQVRWTEALACYEQSLAISRQLGDRYGEGKALARLGSAHRRQGRWAEAVTMYQESLRIFRELGARHDEGNTLDNLGNIYSLQGRWAEALARYEQTLAICRELRDRQGEGKMLTKMGNLYHLQGSWTEALACYEQGLVVCRELGDRQGEGEMLANLGLVYTQQASWVKAIPMYQGSLTICRELGDRLGESEALGALSLIYGRQARWAEALASFQETMHILQELGDRQSEGRMLNELGQVYADQSRWTEAMATYQKGLTVCRESGDRRSEGRILTNLGNIHRLHGRWANAITCYEQNLAICRQLGDAHGEGEALNNLGLVYARQGHWAEATACYKQTLAIYRRVGDARGEGKALTSLGLVYTRQKRWAEATAMYQESLRVSRELEDYYNQGETLIRLGLVYASQGLEGTAVARWYEALAIFEMLGAPEAEQIRGWLDERVGES